MHQMGQVGHLRSGKVGFFADIFFFFQDKEMYGAGEWK